MRPKSDGIQAHFYSIVTKDTKDQQFALNRQLFLTEQGYRYTILDVEDMDMVFHPDNVAGHWQIVCSVVLRTVT